jgi:hypothetical protein
MQRRGQRRNPDLLLEDLMEPAGRRALRAMKAPRPIGPAAGMAYGAHADGTTGGDTMG